MQTRKAAFCERKGTECTPGTEGVPKLQENNRSEFLNVLPRKALNRNRYWGLHLVPSSLKHVFSSSTSFVLGKSAVPKVLEHGRQSPT